MNEIRLPAGVSDIIGRLEQSGYEAYAVGGCIRNSLMGLSPKDYDVTTSASPAEIKRVFDSFRTIDTGIKYGTVTVISDKLPVEVTTYRIDGKYSDNRRPESVEFTTKLAEDLSRRDFTVNALAYNPRVGIVDIFGGKNDLDSKVLKAIGDPDERFREDGLRIMRALRFASCYGLNIEQRTSDSIHRNKALLENISAERTAAELNRMICGECMGVLREYYDVISVFLPEFADCKGFEQHTKYHDRDVLEHIIATVGAIAPVKHLRLAMLLHDLGKPSYFRMSEDGVGHFKGHAKGSCEIAERFFKRLKYDTWTKERVLTLICAHDIVIENREPLLKRYLGRYGEDVLQDIIDVHIADDKGKSPMFQGRIPQYEAAKQTVNEIVEKQQCFSLRSLAVNGNDMKKLGYSGKEIGEKLSFLLELVIDGKCENKKDALIKALTACQKTIIL